jgi:hypothetical protein
MFSSSFFFLLKSRRLRDNVEKCGGKREDTNNVTVWPISVARLISKVTRAHAHAQSHASGHPHGHTRAQIHTHKCVILIAFSQQQWFRERASFLRYTYIVSLIFFKQNLEM